MLKAIKFEKNNKISKFLKNAIYAEFYLISMLTYKSDHTTVQSKTRLLCSGHY